jgi:hypothetical protein
MGFFLGGKLEKRVGKTRNPNFVQFMDVFVLWRAQQATPLQKNDVV